MATAPQQQHRQRFDYITRTTIEQPHKVISVMASAGWKFEDWIRGYVDEHDRHNEFGITILFSRELAPGEQPVGAPSLPAARKTRVA